MQRLKANPFILAAVGIVIRLAALIWYVVWCLLRVAPLIMILAFPLYGIFGDHSGPKPIENELPNKNYFLAVDRSDDPGYRLVYVYRYPNVSAAWDGINPDDLPVLAIYIDLWPSAGPPKFEYQLTDQQRQLLHKWRSNWCSRVEPFPTPQADEPTYEIALNCGGRSFVRRYSVAQTHVPEEVRQIFQASKPIR